MIPAPLSLLARTLPLGDAEQLDALMRRLLSADGRTEKGGLHGHTPRAIEARYPRRFRPNEAELAKCWVEQEGGGDPHGLDWLEAVFDGYFRFDGDRVTAREDRRLEYASLCAQIHPALPVAWRLSGLLPKAGDLRLELADIRRVVDAAASSFLPVPEGDAVWADLHVHLGGSTETSLNLFHLAISRWVPPHKADLPSHDHDRVERTVVKRRMATYQTLFYLLLRRLAVARDGADHDWTEAKPALNLAWILGQPARPSLQPKAWLALHRNLSGISEESRLAYSAIACYAEGDSQRAWLYWLTALCLRFRLTRHGREKTAILAFFNLAHLFRRDMIHEGVGLTRFVRYFESPIRKAAQGTQREEDGLRQLLGHRRQRAELKVTDWIADKDEAITFARRASRLLYQPSRQQQAEALQTCLRRMHICIHFKRGAGKKDDKLRHEACRRNVLAEAQKIDNFLRSASAARARIGGVAMDLTTFVRGLDVAGDELATPVEVFAPAIRWLRRGPLRSSVPAPRPAIRRLHLSIHAGEDYNHLLGGLRHLDETVEFCEMGQHDRLGHALALGIRPQDWLSRQPEALVTVKEHLDNLVWAWSQALALAGRWPGAEAVALRLEARIRIYGPVVYPDYRDRLTPDELYRAWRLRRNCPIKWREHRLRRVWHGGLRFWVPDAKSPDANEQGLPYRLNNAYQELHRSRNEHGRIVLVRGGNSLPSLENPWEDWLSGAELEFMEAAQDHLLDQYAKRGLIIEVNPSSNVYVGRIDDYYQHPVFRWHPPRDEWLIPGGRCNRFGLRTGAMPVCVNTDDPGIFPTSLPNEFHLLEKAAQTHHDIGPLEAARWVDGLRRFGVDQFIRAR